VFQSTFKNSKGGSMEKLSNEQALDVIKKMIEKTKEDQCYAGFFHLLWGVIVSAAIVVMYFLLKAGLYSWISISWAGFSIVGVMLSIIHTKKNIAKKGNTNFPEQALNAMWTGAMISLVFVTFVFPLLKAYEWSVVFVMVSVLLGSVNFSTGYFLKDKLSIFNGIVWWIGSVILLLLNNYLVVLLAFVGLVLINNIIPGIYLYIKAGKQNG
jgi:hypothetical protein